VAIYRGKTRIIDAETSYAAQLQAAQLFHARKSYDVSVSLVETDDGRTITQVITS
jgi:hypothetical protein